MRFAFVSAHPAPYRDPFLRRLSRSQTPDFGLKIFSLYSDDSGHDFWNLGDHGYESEVVGVRGTRWFVMFWRLLRKVICGPYDVICWPGFHRPCTQWAMVLCALIGRHYGFCADSVVQPKRGGLTMLLKRLVINRARFIFVPGKAGVNFFSKTFGYPVERICKGAYALEGGEIEKKVLDYREEERDEIRQKFGIGKSDVVFLMVANMLANRHYPIMSRAFLRFASTTGVKSPNSSFRFVMVGKGPDLEEMRRMAAEHPELVIVPGVSFEEMLKLYAAADVYVHGGTEPASTALVIGAISHLPVMSSPAVGCTADVVRDGETGVLVQNYLSEDEWASAFGCIWDARMDWVSYGTRARELSRELDCGCIIDELKDLIKH